MPTPLESTAVGDWFTTSLREERFEIVAIDGDAATVAIQYYDGTVEEIDFESWPQLEAEAIDQPEDWTGAFDADREDLGDEPTPMLSMSDAYDNIERLLY